MADHTAINEAFQNLEFQFAEQAAEILKTVINMDTTVFYEGQDTADAANLAAFLAYLKARGIDDILGIDQDPKLADAIPEAVRDAITDRTPPSGLFSISATHVPFGSGRSTRRSVRPPWASTGCRSGSLPKARARAASPAAG